MPLFVTFLHVLLCVALILIILLQPGKDSASVFGGGGGGNQMYGPRGQANFLGRATTVIAAMFMVTSITLALYSSESVQQGSNIEEEILRLEREGGYNAKREEAPPAPEPDEAPGTLLAPEGTAPVGSEGPASEVPAEDAGAGEITPEGGAEPVEGEEN